MKTMNLNSKEGRLEDLLARMAESIQLDETRKAKMESSYSAIKDLLDNDDAFFSKLDFELYPQGSVKIGTTVKPLKGSEFDLDIVIHLKTDWTKYSSSRIYNEVKRVLMSNANYSDKVELKNRCIRLNYTGDYHMDILPGIQEYEWDKDQLKVPDRELKDWTTSNPRGYAKWFEEKAESVQETLLEKAIRAEDLEIEPFAKKKPLKRAVQLIKMYRDQFFEKKEDLATSSIILTTIFGNFYNSESSIFETIENVLLKLDATKNNLRRIKVTNPKNPEEDFSEKWDDEPELYNYFLKFIDNMKLQWQKLKEENDYAQKEIMKSLFSESAYNTAFESQNKYLKKIDKIKAEDYSGLISLANTQTKTQKPYFKE